MRDDKLIEAMARAMREVICRHEPAITAWDASNEAARTVMREQALAALAALQREWAVVPREPTDAMLTAAWNECTAGDARTYRQAWAAMIAAAPQPEEAP